RLGQVLPLEDFLVHPHDKDLLIVGPVEDADPSPLGQTLDVAPQEVVRELFPRGLFERKNLASLRIYSRHDMLDRAVFAGGVHRWEYEQQRPAILGVEPVLPPRQPVSASSKQFGRLALAELKAAGVAGVDFL